MQRCLKAATAEMQLVRSLQNKMGGNWVGGTQAAFCEYVTCSRVVGLMHDTYHGWADCSVPMSSFPRGCALLRMIWPSLSKSTYRGTVSSHCLLKQLKFLKLNTYLSLLKSSNTTILPNISDTPLSEYAVGQFN